jgi:dienelactone hydrolase
MGCRYWKTWLLAYAIIFTLTATEKSRAQSANDDDIHISAIAELYFLRVYQKAKGHKALAVGPAGYWASAEGRPSARAAEKAALANCQATLRKAPFRSLSSRRCILFDVDGKATGHASPIGVPFGTVREGRDYPLEFGKMWEPSTPSRKGIMVMVHGCNPIGPLGGLMISWINFYRAAGLQVFLPNSFAEPRDGELCGNPGEHGIDQQTRTLKLRIAQTRHTLAGLRKRFPADPIYLHGHSEGGYVVQALGEKAAGIIVTGSQCGFGYASAYWAAPGTPILVIAGTKDSYIYKARNAKELTAYCKAIRGEGKLKAVSVAGMGHVAAVWWPGLRDAVNTFLDIEPIVVTRRKPDGMTVADIPSNILEQYRSAASPKALAADEKGNWSWYASEDARYATNETKLDAEEIALFDCDEKARLDPYQDASHQHACVLVDVNGKRLVK